MELTAPNNVYRLRPDVYPEPFTGDPAAPVYFINLNPGFASEETEHADMPRVKDYVFKNYRHEHHNPEVPLSTGSTPRWKGTGGGRKN